MTHSSSFQFASTLSLHLTNISGVGATHLLQSLLPSLEKNSSNIKAIYLPATGDLSKYKSIKKSTIVRVYKRFLPNSLSRVLECVLPAKKFNDSSRLLVLGDLPLRYLGKQTLFVQTPNLIYNRRLMLGGEIKYIVSRVLFAINIKHVRSVIVQTNFMREEIERCYPYVVGRIHVIPQPVPVWLLNSSIKRTRRKADKNEKLSLIYPASGYPHKNHFLLSELVSSKEWHIEKLILTIEERFNPAKHIKWIDCVGYLDPGKMLEFYSEVDALLFLSKKESFGFPLVEAMYLGLPIVCPDLPYARILCGEEAIYFDPDSTDSLDSALALLRTRLDEGWWPDWTIQLRAIPSSWDDVAKKMLEIAAN